LVRRVRKEAPAHLPDVSLDLTAEFKQWKPEAQQRAMAMLKEYEGVNWHPFFCSDRTCDGKPHGDWDWQHARADQWPPPMGSHQWLTLCFSGGRGAGKSRTGSEITHRMTAHVPRLFLIAATGPDLRETMIEGISGILATSPPGRRPLWEPSKKRLTWPNGCIAQGFSAEEPDRLRGPEAGFVWADEPAHYPLIDEVWSTMLLGLRLGNWPKVVATTTPKPVKWMKALIKDPLTITRRVSTYANLDNLAEAFKLTVLDRFEGTRLGRQELHGEILEDIEGALWIWDMFQWVEQCPPLVRCVVAVDPAGSTRAGADETGIVVIGAGFDKHLYVLHDATHHYSPAGWAKKANDLYEQYHCDAIVAEKNYGGDMVRHTLETSGHGGARVIVVDSRRGKAIRAEPIVARYERKMVSHVGVPGDLAELEDELTSWVPGQGPSPNRVDALVHGGTQLLRQIEPVAVADPNRLLRRRPPPTSRPQFRRRSAML
jgi:phage terminase large subunit-like protein